MRFGGRPFGDPEVKETALLIAPRLYGYGVGQISFLISSRTLAALGNAYVTFNFCAFRVVDLVLGGFAVSLTRAVLPPSRNRRRWRDASLSAKRCRCRSGSSPS